MSNFSKWNDINSERYEEGKYGTRVILFVSRKKDNKYNEKFKERREAFITTKDINDPIIQRRFSNFVEAGVEGEVSRFYISVNRRDQEKMRDGLFHYLIDHPDINLASLPQKLASIAAKSENALEHKWLFDYDMNKEDFKYFLQDFNKYHKEYDVHTTPNGYAVVSSTGFDTRELLAKWTNVTLKRDDLLFVDIYMKK